MNVVFKVDTGWCGGVGRVGRSCTLFLEAFTFATRLCSTTTHLCDTYDVSPTKPDQYDRPRLGGVSWKITTVMCLYTHAYEYIFRWDMDFSSRLIDAHSVKNLSKVDHANIRGNEIQNLSNVDHVNVMSWRGTKEVVFLIKIMRIFFNSTRNPQSQRT